MKISVIGLGYVGLPTMLLLSKSKHKIYGYDTNFKLIENLKNGKYVNQFHLESNISSLYKKQLSNKKLNFDTKLNISEVYIICVPTPVNKKYKADTSYVDSVIKNISKLLKEEDLIIIESTLPIKYSKNAYKKLKKIHKNINFYLSYCPERVLPGNTLKELENNNRVIGGICIDSTIKSEKIYKLFVKGKIYKTSTSVSEFTKLAENAYRDINIAYSNELSILCKINNVDYKQVIKYANMHPRVNILNPGIGVGGHCIPVDPWFLIENYNKDFSIIKNSRKVNKDKTLFICDIIIKEIKKINSIYKKDYPILFLGLAYKPNVGDLRESPAVEIVKKISKKFKNKIYLNEPHVSINKDLFLNKIQTIDLKNGIEKSKIIFKLVDHDCYKKIRNKLTKIKNFFDYSDCD